ncbi:uncharacterized protein LOC143291074 [Babylonia areolata]|uniref:uncharacterized protein LOC143291074 n=1 Tax=Babylonia areolata TaxID=304850 RepID=UPI003FD0FD2A
MATGTQPTNKDKFTERDVRLSCSLCMESYRGRSPKILPCYHTFCLPCLIALEASAAAAGSSAPDGTTQQSDVKCGDVKEESLEKQEAADGEGGVCDGDANTAVCRDGGGKVVFLCPTCRAPVPVPDGGVATLQTNFYVKHELSDNEDEGDAAKASPPVLCGTCEEGNQQPATHVCQQCQAHLCRPCRRFHDRLMPTHSVTAVGTARPVPEKTAAQPQQQRCCLVHQDQVLCFHCRQCEVSICLHCKLTAHEGHDTADLASAALQAKRELPSLMATIQEQLQVVESALEQGDREDRQLTGHAQEVTRQIHARHDMLVAWARQARDRLLEDVSGKEATSRGLLTAHKSSTALIRQSLSSLLSRAAQTTSTDPDVVTLKTELKEALLSEEKLQLLRKRAEKSDGGWGWDYDTTDAAVLHADDVRAYMGRIAEGPEVGTPEPTVSLRELAERVDRWMSEVRDTTSTMTSELTSCKGDLTTLHTEAAGLERKVQSLNDALTAAKKREDGMGKKIQSLSSDMRKFSTLSDDLSTQKQSAADLQQRTQSLEKKMETCGKTVSFCAVSYSVSETKQGSAIVFNNIKVNVGGCYDSATGIFRVSVPGCYVFTSSIGAGGSRDNIVRAYIMVDDTDYAHFRGSYTSVGCSSTSVQLKRGQRVWVKADCDVGHYCSPELCFTGALVQPEL